MGQWKDIFNHLKTKGFDIYPPATKLGECSSNYLVLLSENESRVAGISTTQQNYSILCYVPLNSYSTLEDYVYSVKEAMKELHPKIRYNYVSTPPYYDDAIKAHMVSVEYLNYRLIERR